MTGHFESLFYTDCRQGRGLRGGAGFQFQAVSAGATDEMMNLVQRRALYEAPLTWMRQQRAVSAYPPSLTHVHDGVYATARGVYLGAEAGGAREGNQFTHAVCTSDPQAYGPLRPAQLWDAPWWSERAAAGTTCDPLPGEPDPGPCRVEALRDWVLGKHDGQEWLLAVNSALERVHEPGGRRVVFVGSTAGDVVRWIAAGTLLLPHERALRVGFRVFAADLRYSGHEVVALHPDWAGTAADIARDDGFAVFDLESGRHSPVEPTCSAQHWVPRFLRDDPYDVVDAVELAHHFARDGGREHATPGDRLAAAVLTFGDAADDPDQAFALADWLESDLDEDTSTAVTRAVLAGRPGAAVLRRLAESVHRGPDRVAGEVRTCLLRAEIDEIVRGSTEVPGPPPERPWSPSELERAQESIEESARIAAPDQLDALLRLATGFGITPRVERFRDAADRLVRWWADRPEAADPAGWSCRAPLVRQLRQELDFRLRGPQPHRTDDAVREHWWRLLLPVFQDPLTRVDAAVAGTAVAAGGRARRKAVARFRNAVRESDRDDIAEAAWQALFRHTPPTAAEAVDLLPREEITDPLADLVLADLDQSDVDGDYLDVLRRLDAHVPARLRYLRTEDDELREWLSAAQGNAKIHPPRVSEPVFRARTSGVVEALLRMSLGAAAIAAARFEEAFQPVLVRALTGSWADGAPERLADRAVALAFLISRAEGASGPAQRRAGDAVDEWATAHRSPDHVRISRLLRTEAPDRAAGWHEVVREPGRSARRLFGLLRDRRK